MSSSNENPIYGPFFGVMGAASAIIFSGKHTNSVPSSTHRAGYYTETTTICIRVVSHKLFLFRIFIIVWWYMQHRVVSSRNLCGVLDVRSRRWRIVDDRFGKKFSAVKNRPENVKNHACHTQPPVKLISSDDRRLTAGSSFSSRRWTMWRIKVCTPLSSTKSV